MAVRINGESHRDHLGIQKVSRVWDVASALVKQQLQILHETCMAFQ